MAQTFYMPMRGERTAPIFDSTRVRDLPKSFTELERLFRRANITDDNEKKKQVVYYTNIDTEQIWQYTVLNQSIRWSQVIGLPKLSEMSQGHRSQGQVPNLSSKSKNPKKWVLKVARCFFKVFRPL